MVMAVALNRLTQKIYKKLTDEDFPQQFGCRYKMRCPALEFVKFICKILSLDKNIANQVNKLKKDLLSFVNVREFSDQAQYMDPSLSFTIPQVSFGSFLSIWTRVFSFRSRGQDHLRQVQPLSRH